MTLTTDITGVHPGILDSDYHAHPALSSSGARLILDSPAKFKWSMEHPKHATYFDIGSYVHAEVLGAGSPVTIIEADSYRTKAAQEARDNAYADGKIPMLKGDLAAAHAMRDAVWSHPTAADLLGAGEPELSLFWEDQETGVPLRARLDWLRREPTPIVVDLKTTAGSAAPNEFAVTAAKYRYYIQEAFYRAGVRATGIGDCDFYYITVEKQPPNLVSVTRLHPDAVTLGDTLMRQAVRTYAACLETDTWPGYGDDITEIDLPAWAYYSNNTDDVEIVIP